MLAKKPILESSNKINSPAELSGCGLHVRPEDAKAIAEGILELKKLCSKDLEKMGESGYQYVLKFHNFEYLSDHYLKLF